MDLSFQAIVICLKQSFDFTPAFQPPSDQQITAYNKAKAYNKNRVVLFYHSIGNAGNAQYAYGDHDCFFPIPIQETSPLDSGQDQILIRLKPFFGIMIFQRKWHKP
jgi:hypothetical protein